MINLKSIFKFWKNRDGKKPICVSTDPVCGMKQEKGKGIEKGGNWFCSKNCLEKFEKGLKKMDKGGCCGGH